ncbi:hypothetical protein ALMP_84440 [Streptomyces sp. A012304]|nr:hypothetical protein ALMP_84440 [Streptomyces sp. A012304]
MLSGPLPGTYVPPGAEMGPLVGDRQLETVTRHVDEALAKGAKVVAGGVTRPDIGPFFYEPTILDGVSEPMAVCTQETFGPVVSIYRFKTDEEAIEHANGTPYGLDSPVWTKNGRRGHAVAAQLRTGTVNVNEGYAPAYGQPPVPDGRHEGLRPRPPPRLRGHPQKSLKDPLSRQAPGRRLVCPVRLAGRCTPRRSCAAGLPGRSPDVLGPDSRPGALSHRRE